MVRLPTTASSHSVIKSEVVIFNRLVPPHLRTVRLGGAALPVSKSFLYLGVLVDRTKGVKASVVRAAARGRAAIAAMLRRLHELDMGSSIRTTLSMYSAGPMQAMLYGCEVWGQHCMSVSDPAVSGLEAEQVHRNFVRHTLGMRHSSKAWIAFREAGMYPLQHTCLGRMLKFVENILALPTVDVCRQAMLDCIEWCQRSDTDLRGAWIRQLVALIAHVCPADTPLLELIDLPRLHLDIDACMAAWRAHHHDAAWGGLAADPRTAPSANVTMCTYHRWFAMDLPVAGEHWLMPPHLTTPRVPWHHAMSVSRLRTGCHELAVQRLRIAAVPHGGQRVPRHQRYCFCCEPAAPGVARPVQDELHCVMECTSLQAARASYPSLFAAHNNAQQAVHSTLRSMFTVPGHVRALASFVHTHVLPMGDVLPPPPPG
jgi:hypothetical protein